MSAGLRHSIVALPAVGPGFTRNMDGAFGTFHVPATAALTGLVPTELTAYRRYLQPPVPEVDPHPTVLGAVAVSGNGPSHDPVLLTWTS